MNLDFIERILNRKNPIMADAIRGSADKAQHAVIPKDMEIKSLKFLVDEYRTKPDRRTGTHKLDTLPSFVGLVNRFKADASVLFGHGEIDGTEIAATLRAYFNYHPESGDNTAAAYCDHMAVYEFPVSKEFQFWIDGRDNLKSQADFCNLIEARLADLADGSLEELSVPFGVEKPIFAGPAALLQLARGLEIRVDESIKQAYRSNSGEMTLQFTTEHKDNDGQPIVIPKWFLLALPIFEGGAIQKIPVKLNYRVDRGSNTVKLGYSLYRVEDIFQAAFDQGIHAAVEATGLPIFMGIHLGS